jgi:hypothetical protein
VFEFAQDGFAVPNQARHRPEEKGSPPPGIRAMAVEAYSCRSQIPQKKASRMDSAMKTIWNAFSDILSDLDDVPVRHRPQRKKQQTGEKESGEASTA